MHHLGGGDRLCESTGSSPSSPRQTRDPSLLRRPEHRRRRRHEEIVHYNLHHKKVKAAMKRRLKWSNEEQYIMLWVAFCKRSGPEPSPLSTLLTPTPKGGLIQVCSAYGVWKLTLKENQEEFVYHLHLPKGPFPLKHLVLWPSFHVRSRIVLWLAALADPLKSMFFLHNIICIVD
ncbi:hypothetical protein QYE76_000582 [Lolium multiflorum]|uniref:Uncharacterized protein n=1 Tax=Lolium multiflorum TaxID=4521 RepID=A0AAD8VWI4_LOLMU|nr:hypothetical protein QYE76_000582 [Lolium multiflorum]